MASGLRFPDGNFMGARKFSVLIFMISFAMLLAIACGDKETAGRENAAADLTVPPQYDGWIADTTVHFIMHYPGDVVWLDQTAEISAFFERMLKEDCFYLSLPLPESTIHVYTYNSPNQAAELTGREVPFIVAHQIHWDKVLTPIGAGLMMYLIENSGRGKPGFDFLYDGLLTLRDYSKNNYHHLTGVLIQMELYIPLDSLGDNEAYRRQDDRSRSHEAASLVAFLTYVYGVEVLPAIWTAGTSLREVVTTTLESDFDTLEETWKKFALERCRGAVVDTIKLGTD